MSTLPIVSTQVVTNISDETATGNGTITDLGSGNITKRGICWNTTGTPTVADDKVEEVGNFGLGAFYGNMTNLIPDQYYHVRAYAYNNDGYGYGGVINFTTSQSPSNWSLEVSANKHYLQHSLDDTPFLWVADTPWALTMRLDLIDAEFYINDRALRGFTVLQVASVGLGQGMLGPEYQIGCDEKPFLGDDPTTPNEPYWAHVDAIISLAETHGLYIAFTIPWKEFVFVGGKSPKIIDSLNAEAYATWLANRYKNTNNIIWVIGGDTPGAQAPDTFDITTTIGSTIRGIDSNHLITYHGRDSTNPTCLSSSCLFHDQAWLDFNMSYPNGYDTQYMAFMYDYNLTSPIKPSLCGECCFSGWGNIQTRRQFYCLFLCGGCGFSHGQESVWDMWQDSDLNHVYDVTSGTDWQLMLDNQEGTLELLRATDFFGSIEWWKLIPDNNGIIMSGAGSGEWFKTAARSSDGDIVLIYYPNETIAEIDMSHITTENNIQAKWYRTTVDEELIIGTYPASGTQSFTPPPGWEDALLVLSAFADNNDWLTGWSKRRKITLTGGADGAQTDYQLKLSITYNSSMQSDFDDLRFTRSDGVTLVDAWLESKIDSTSAAIWVEFPTTPANGDTEEYYMYYGNSGIGDIWNGTDTFIFFDDAETGAFSDKWNQIKGSQSDYTTSEHYNGLKSIACSNTSDSAIIAAKNIDAGDAAFDMMAKIPNGYGFVSARSSTIIEETYYFREQSNSNTSQLYQKFGGNWTLLDEDSSSDVITGWNLYSIRCIGTSIKTYFNDDLRNSGISSDILSGSVGARSGMNEPLYIDDVRIRKYVENPAEYVLGSETGQYMIIGDEYEFNNEDVSYISTERIDDTHFLIAYRTVDVIDDDYYVRVGTVNDKIITYGTPVFVSPDVTYNDISLLDSTHFIIAYRDSDTHGTARIGTISGTSISLGSEYDFNATNTTYISVSALSSTCAVIAYVDSSNYGRSIIATISGSSINYGSAYTLYSSGATSYISTEKIDSTHFLISDRELWEGLDDDLAIRVGTVSGSTITWGSQKYVSPDVTYNDISLLDSTHFIIAYRDSDTHGTARIGTISGTSISLGSEYDFNATNTTYISVSALNSNKAIIGYYNDTDGNVIVATSTSVISYGNEYIFNNGSTTYISLNALTEKDFVIGFRDSDTHGKAVAGSVLGLFVREISSNLLIKKLGINKSSTLDTIIKKIGELAVVSNTLLLKTVNKIVTSNTLIQKTYNIVSSTNVLFKKRFNKIITSDSMFVHAINKLFSSDLILFKSNITRLLTSNTLVKKLGIVKNLTSNFIMVINKSATIIVDSILIDIIYKIVTNDVLIRKTNTISGIVDGIIKKVRSVSSTINTEIKKSEYLNISNDSLIMKLVVNNITTDTVVKLVDTKNIIINTLFKKLIDINMIVDIILKRLNNRSIISDALLKKLVHVTATIDTKLGKRGTGKFVSVDMSLVFTKYIRSKLKSYSKNKSRRSYR